MRKEKKKPKWKRPLMQRILMGLIAVFVCLNTTVTAYARTLVYIQCSLDLSTWEILSAVIEDNYGWTSHSLEVRRVDKSDLDSLASGSESLSAAITALKGLQTYVDSYGSDDPEQKKLNGNVLGAMVTAGEDNRILSFPGVGQSETADMNQALDVNDALIFDLNQAFSIWLENQGIEKTPDLSAFHTAIINFLSSVSSHASGDKYTITDREGETYTYTWRVLKGYDGSNPDLRTVSSGEDAKYVNWGMLAFEAFNNFVLEGNEAVTSSTVYASNPGQLEKVITQCLSSVLNGLRGLLGLWSMDDLLFNQGLREKGYVGGIFPKNWEPTVWALFFIMEVFAAMILMFGVINNVLKKAVSTMNTVARMHAMSKIQDLIVCALALSLLPVLLRMLLTISSDFTAMIYSMITPPGAEPEKIENMVMRYTAGSGSLAGIIGQFLFFGVQVYFNFFYALRSLTVAILIVIAPIMIALISVSDARKQTTIAWAKELTVNIVIQPMQALVMAIVLLLPNSSHGFDNLIALYALIPFTSMLKSLIFGPSGGWMENAANRARSRMTGALAGGAMAAGGALIGAGVNAVSSRGGGGGDSNSGDSSSCVTDSQNRGEVTTQTQSPVSLNQGDANTTQPSPAVNSDGNPEQIARAGERYSDTGVAQTLSRVSQGIHGGAANLIERGKASDYPADRLAAHGAEWLGTRAGPAAAAGAASAARTVGTFAGGTLRGIPGAALAGLGGVMGGAGVGGANGITNLGNRMSQGAGRRPYEGGANGDEDAASSGNSTPSSSVDAGASAQQDSINTTMNPNNYDNVNSISYANNDGTQTTEYDETALKEMGVDRMRYDQGSKMTSARFNLDKMSAADSASARKMLDISQNGTEEQKQALRDMGIKSVQPVYQNSNGQQRLMGMNMDFDAKKYAQATGTSFRRGASITSAVGTEPQMLPRIDADFGQKSDAPVQTASVEAPANSDPASVSQAAQPAADVLVDSSPAAASVAVVLGGAAADSAFVGEEICEPTVESTSPSAQSIRYDANDRPLAVQDEGAWQEKMDAIAQSGQQYSYDAIPGASSTQTSGGAIHQLTGNDAISEAGISSLTYHKGTTSFSVDPEKLHELDRGNLEAMAYAFQMGDRPRIEKLKSQGVKFVGLSSTTGSDGRQMNTGYRVEIDRSSYEKATGTRISAGGKMRDGTTRPSKITMRDSKSGNSQLFPNMFL